jgi:hypothetical protein
MRPAGMLLGAAVALALAWPARGESVPSTATVLTDGAEVRCKPGTEPAVYVTQKLARGSAVQVVERTKDGWLKIEPPLPGSYSWVNTRYLQPTKEQRVWLVNSADAPVTSLVGSWVTKERPNVVGTTLKPGTQLIAIGGTLHENDGDWLPVQPPPGEYRYVLAKDVSAPPGASSPAPVNSARPGSAATTSGAGELPSLPPAGTDSPPQSREVHVGGQQPAGDPTLQQAEQLERSGDKIGAARLYEQLGRKNFDTNHEAAVQFFTKAASLRNGTTAAAPAPVTEADAAYQAARQAEDAHNWPEAIRNYTRLGYLYRDDYKWSQLYYSHANWLKQLHPAPAAVAPTTTPTTTTPSSPLPTVVQSRAISLQEVGPGRVVPARMMIDGQAAYVLESAQATVLAYLSPQPGVNLERYVGQNVRSVLGNSTQRSNLTAPYMKVTRVVPLDPPQ